MEDIRAIEDETKRELDEVLRTLLYSFMIQFTHSISQTVLSQSVLSLSGTGHLLLRLLKYGMNSDLEIRQLTVYGSKRDQTVITLLMRDTFKWPSFVYAEPTCSEQDIVVTTSIQCMCIVCVYMHSCSPYE